VRIDQRTHVRIGAIAGLQTELEKKKKKKKKKRIFGSTIEIGQKRM
jgi:hypothetical protein